MTLTVGSLFSGIGGLDLGLERAGMRVIWQSEIDPYATRVLAKHWPEVPNLGDIKRINWGDVIRPDVICGGYPCQPFSTAGQRKGEEDPRHLWPWVREAIRLLRPRYAILENVRGHLSLGGSTVLSEIAALGYSAEWRVVSAASVGANQWRDRIIIVAYPNDDGQPPTQKPRSSSSGSDNSQTGTQPPRKPSRRSIERASMADTDSSSSSDGRERQDLSSEDRSRRNDRGGSYSDPREITLRGSREDPGDLANAESFGGHERQHGNDPEKAGKGRLQVSTGGSGRDDDLANPESRVDVRRIGSSRNDRSEVYGGDNIRRGTTGYAGGKWWETEPDVGRVAHGVPARVDRLRGLGNAVVPQVAEVIGRLVVAHSDREPR